MWNAVIEVWHDKGAISDGQRRRLFAIAAENGWQGEDVSAIIHHHLGSGTSELPWGKPYDAVVEIFNTCEPVAAD